MHSFADCAEYLGICVCVLFENSSPYVIICCVHYEKAYQFKAPNCIISTRQTTDLNTFRLRPKPEQIALCPIQDTYNNSLKLQVGTVLLCYVL